MDEPTHQTQPNLVTISRLHTKNNHGHNSIEQNTRTSPIKPITSSRGPYKGPVSDTIPSVVHTN
jgi:hypothetical protein